MEPRPLEQQCWHCGLALGTGHLVACPNCETPLRPPAEADPDDDHGPARVEPAVESPLSVYSSSTPDHLPTAGEGVSVERLQRDPVLTPWLRTTLLCLLIVVLLAGVGIMAGRIVGS